MVDALKYQVKFRIWERMDDTSFAGTSVQLFYCLDEPLGLVLIDRGQATDARLFRVFPIGEPEEIARETYIKGIDLDNLLTHFASVYEPRLHHVDKT